jgi:hypothetical protein
VHGLQSPTYVVVLLLQAPGGGRGSRDNPPSAGGPKTPYNPRSTISEDQPHFHEKLGSGACTAEMRRPDRNRSPAWCFSVSSMGSAHVARPQKTLFDLIAELEPRPVSLDPPASASRGPSQELPPTTTSSGEAESEPLPTWRAHQLVDLALELAKEEARDMLLRKLQQVSAGETRH